MHPIYSLIHYALNHKLIEPLDIDYAFNRLTKRLKIVGLKPPSTNHVNIEESIDQILKPLLDEAVKTHIIAQDTTLQRDLFEAEIMDIFTPRPSDLNKRFFEIYKTSKTDATDDFYALSHATNYIKTSRISKNIKYKVPSTYGEIEITINLSKPEKDPKDIASAIISTDYPTCLLCKENVGYYGNLSQPARTNHRIIKLTLNKEPFYFQYSPYVYYNEHAIVLHEDHIPMKIGEHTFKRLLDFVDLFPHYFMGSNAGLPIVGGSILNHEHYQGGRAHFPIESAKVLETFVSEDVTYKRLYWPLSTIRLESSNRSQLIEHAEKLRLAWLNYTNHDLNIIAKTDQEHNAITPIVRKNKETYIIDIALRNNRTSEAHPDGIFHPHQDKHHIKKENIGLIEVMGLAILPGRLKNDLASIKALINNEITTFKEIETYQDWISKLIKTIPSTNLDRFIEKAVGDVFIECLEDCGVFAQNETHQKAFTAFIKQLINN